MESNNINRISATGLKSIEIDELNTPQIVINNEGLQYYHEYNILLLWHGHGEVILHLCADRVQASAHERGLGTHRLHIQ